MLLLGLACIAVLYMFFVGNPLFGIKYVSFNEDQNSNAFVAEQNVETVNITNTKFDIKIVETVGNEISLKVHNGVFGFVKTANSHLSLTESLKGKTLNFAVEEPHGFAISNNSYIQLNVPTNSKLNLVLNTNNCTTTIDLKNSTIANLSYSAAGGTVNFVSGKVEGQMDLDLGRAKFNIADAVQTNNNDVNLRLTSGAFNCQNKEFNSINLISSTSGVIRAKACAIFKGKNINAGGSVTIGTVSQKADVEAGDTNITIGTLQFGIIMLHKSGKISLTSVVGNASLTTNSGNITVAEAQSLIICSTTSGNVDVKSALGTANLHSASGNVNISFAENALHYNSPQTDGLAKPRRLIAETDTGKITARGVENVEINLNRGSANVYMENVFGNNLIQSSSGAVYLEVKLNTLLAEDLWPSFRFISHTAGAVSVNFAEVENQGTGGFTDKDLDFEVNHNSTTKNNTLKIVSVSGSIRARNDIISNF